MRQNSFYFVVSASVGAKQFTSLLTVMGKETKTRQVTLDNEKGANHFHSVVLWRRGKTARSKNHL